jgi:two-component system, chemotaxis family, chemotaxis protein CheY
VQNAREADEPYDLICLDIMMPEMDGQTALKQIRAIEEHTGVISSHLPNRWTRREVATPISSVGAKIIMISALSDHANIARAYAKMSDAYLVKPFQKSQLIELLRTLKLVP